MVLSHDSNPQPVNRKSDALPIVPPRHLVLHLSCINISSDDNRYTCTLGHSVGLSAAQVRTPAPNIKDKHYTTLTWWFNSNCPTLTPKVTSGKKLSQCRECVFRQKRFQFILENVRVCYFLNCMGQAVPSFRSSMRKQHSLNFSWVVSGSYHWVLQIWDRFWKGYLQ